MENIIRNQDQGILSKHSLKEFVQDSFDLFGDKALIITYQDQARKIDKESIIYNVLSAAFALFGIWILSGRSHSGKSMALLVILAGLIILIEVFKRVKAKEIAYSWYIDKRLLYLSCIVLLIPTAISMALSFYGGNELAPELRGSPTLLHNPQIDSLNLEIATLEKTIQAAQATTWKGRIVRNAQAIIKESTAIKSGLLDQRSQLQAADREENSLIQDKHGQETQYLGYFLGLVAILFDLLLYRSLTKFMRLKYEVSILVREKPEYRALLSDTRWLQPVVTNGNGSIQTGYEGVDEATLTMALKNARQNMQAWQNKIDKGIGSVNTNEQNIQKWKAKIEAIQAELKYRATQSA